MYKDPVAMVPPTRIFIYKNTYWESYGLFARILGILLFVFGLIIQILEIVRIYNGLYNFGPKNYQSGRNLQNGPPNPSNSFFLYAEPWHIWPWTYAGSVFGLIFMLAGLVGFLSSVQKSYTMIFSFFTFSLFALLFSIFLIVYYSIIINYYSNVYTGPLSRLEVFRQSLGLVGTNLALTLLSLILSFVSVFVAQKAGGIGNVQKDYVDVNSSPKYSVSSQ